VAIVIRKTVLLLALMATTLLLASGLALAALSNTPDAGTVGTNGRVWDILRAGDKIYLAGSFTQVIEPDGTTVERNHLAAVDANTGRLTAWDPNVTKLSGEVTVHKMARSAGGARLFVAGNFGRVGGLPRSNLAAVDPATGAVDPDWRADANNTIFALSVSGSKLYLGGAFTEVAGQPRERLAAVATATGALDPNWKPSAHRLDDLKANVRALDVSADGTRIYAGGLFSYISGVYTRRLAAIDAATGAVDRAFNPATPNTILDMDVANGRVYVAAGDQLEGIEAFDATTGQLQWSIPGGYPDAQAGDVQAIVATPGGKVYAGGHFGQMGGLVRKRLVKVDGQTGQIGPWVPHVRGDSVSLGVWALETDPQRGRLYAGGDFTEIGSAEYLRFARFPQQTTVGGGN
jgi:hypothetical protein